MERITGVDKIVNAISDLTAAIEDNTAAINSQTDMLDNLGTELFIIRQRVGFMADGVDSVANELSRHRPQNA